MKQIVDKLNKIAKAIDETVEVPTTDLIIDSLDAITKAFGGTPNDSNLIVDKLEDIAGVAHSGITPTGTINITDTALTDVAQYRNAQVSSETLIAENIKKDVEILGVTGTFEGGGGSKKLLVVPTQTVQMVDRSTIPLMELSGSYGTAIMPESITVTFDDVEETVSGVMGNNGVEYRATDYTILYMLNVMPIMAIQINDNLEHTVKVELEPRYYILLHATFNNNRSDDPIAASEFFNDSIKDYIYILDNQEIIKASSVLIPKGTPTLKDVIVSVNALMSGLVCITAPTGLVNCTINDKTIIFDQICAIEDAEATLWAAGTL